MGARWAAVSPQGGPLTGAQQLPRPAPPAGAAKRAQLQAPPRERGHAVADGTAAALRQRVPQQRPGGRLGLLALQAGSRRSREGGSAHTAGCSGRFDTYHAATAHVLQSCGAGYTCPRTQPTSRGSHAHTTVTCPRPPCVQQACARVRLPSATVNPLPTNLPPHTCRAPRRPQVHHSVHPCPAGFLPPACRFASGGGWFRGSRWRAAAFGTTMQAGWWAARYGSLWLVRKFRSKRGARRGREQRQ